MTPHARRSAQVDRGDRGDGQEPGAGRVREPAGLDLLPHVQAHQPQRVQRVFADPPASEGRSVLREPHLRRDHVQLQGLDLGAPSPWLDIHRPLKRSARGPNPAGRLSDAWVPKGMNASSTTQLRTHQGPITRSATATEIARPRHACLAGGSVGAGRQHRERYPQQEDAAGRHQRAEDEPGGDGADWRPARLPIADPHPRQDRDQKRREHVGPELVRVQPEEGKSQGQSHGHQGRRHARYLGGDGRRGGDRPGHDRAMHDPPGREAPVRHRVHDRHERGRARWTIGGRVVVRPALQEAVVARDSFIGPAPFRIAPIEAEPPMPPDVEGERVEIVPVARFRRSLQGSVFHRGRQIGGEAGQEDRGVDDPAQGGP